MFPILDDVEKSWFAPVTWILIILTCVLSIVSLNLPDSATNYIVPYIYSSHSNSLFAVSNISIAIASLFLHADYWHLIFNMLFLFAFSISLEKRIGSRMFLLLYVGSGISSCLFFDLMSNSQQLVLGASGAVSGLIATYLLFFPNAKILTGVVIIWFIKFFYIRAWVYIIPWVLFQIWAIKYNIDSNVAYSAHLGGITFGIAFGLLYMSFNKIITTPRKHYIMKKTSQDLLITLFGAITSLITAIILAYIDRNMNFSLYTLSVWAVIPVGAIGSGFVAASGYYLGSIFFHHKPSKLILLNMVAVSLGTYFLIHYFSYIYLEVDGNKVSNFLSFWQYLDIDASHSTIHLTRSPSSGGFELGNWGYLYAFIQILGFCVGGFSLYAYLVSRVFCENCSRYYHKEESMDRYSGDGETFGNTINEIALLLSQDKFNEAIYICSASCGEHKFNPKNHHLRMRVILMRCKSCESNCLCIEVSKDNKNGWSKIDNLSFNVFTRQQLSLSK